MIGALLCVGGDWLWRARAAFGKLTAKQLEKLTVDDLNKLLRRGAAQQRGSDIQDKNKRRDDTRLKFLEAVMLVAEKKHEIPTRLEVQRELAEKFGLDVESPNMTRLCNETGFGWLPGPRGRVKIVH